MKKKTERRVMPEYVQMLFKQQAAANQLASHYVELHVKVLADAWHAVEEIIGPAPVNKKMVYDPFDGSITVSAKQPGDVVHTNPSKT